MTQDEEEVGYSSLRDIARASFLDGQDNRSPSREALVFTDEQLWPFVHQAGLTWCGRKGRETFIDDERYFKANWKALPGLRAVVVEEAQNWLASLPQAQGGDRDAAGLTDVEAEAALTSEGIFVWGPDGERFERMFNVVMSARKTAPAGGGE